MITRNPLLAEARGGLGKIVVFKQMYGKTVMTNYPRKVSIPPEQQSAAQRETRDRFRDAAAYAKQVLKEPARRAYYEKKKKQLGLYSAYQAAITEYMRKSKLGSVNLKKYTGAPVFSLISASEGVYPVSECAYCRRACAAPAVAV